MLLLVALLRCFKAVTLPRMNKDSNLSLLQLVNFISENGETTLSLSIIIPNLKVE